MRMRNVQVTARRLAVARALLILPFLILSARAAHLSIVDHRGAKRGAAQAHTVLTLAPERGTIVDRAGAELALSIDAPSVYAIPSALEDVDRTARELARALGLDRRGLTSRLRSGYNFVFVARWVEPERARRVRALKLAGVGILDEPRRIYPHRGLAAPVIGFSDIDGNGVRGIEQQEDAWLQGTARRVLVERDARGQLLMPGGHEHWSTAGGDIALTIDAALQAKAEAALGEAVTATGARGGVVISMDPRSGDVLALAEHPGFDPNHFRALDYASTRSRALLDAADPGSTLKAFLVAAALENDAIATDQGFDCENGSFRVPGKTIRDRHPHGELTTAEIVRVSSNIGAVKIAFALGPKTYFKMLRRFGFGEPTGSRFPGESAGVLRSWRSWRPVDHATIAFGQGVSVTPIQLAAATAALANGGEWVRPRLVAVRRTAGGAWKPTGGRVARRAVRPETAAAVVTMLEDAVGAGGTGHRAALRGVRVAGKTGTAQKFDVASGLYAQDRFAAWFVGIVPADDPLLVIVVGLDEPKRPTHTGGTAAAPLFARVAAAQLASFGILTQPRHTAPDRREPAAAPTRAARADPPRPAPVTTRAAAGVPAASAQEIARLGSRVLLPDFRGLTVSEVKQITANSTLELEISGSGRAVAQEPPPGTVLAARDARVHIRFAAREGEG